MANGFMEDYDDRAPSPGEAKAARKLVADAQALADVRTLDAVDPTWHMAVGEDSRRLCVVLGKAFPATAGESVQAAIDSARAKAAAWVREQKR